ncbi:hypothetical protein [Montanilutibacter psychrotolerans]|uniref:Uncharacterized protein n=1 Tax=Montanilutibacter psychrotolerans TaxID=1327343 RepID=A0A3M8T469_9GAMM|nr:hypothetical protein [Lysobacter psychrotolerans]RNF86274.1 hypothetical protein EER27_02290 [Lysobacter psychrotolerans]
MESPFFTVAPSQAGWLLLDGDRIAELFTSRFWALKAADCFAYERHVATGMPTAIIVEMANGEGVFAARYE